MASEIVFEGRNSDARRAVRTFIAILTGQPDPMGLARSVFYTIGIAALSDIQLDFIRKSRGGTGEDGVKWKPLSKEYLAYGRRFGRGEQAALKRAAGLGREHRHGVGGNKIIDGRWEGDEYRPVYGGNTGLLTAEQKQRWNQVFARTLASLAARHDLAKAKGMAAAHAWNVLKGEGAKTKLEVFGNRQVEILRDTGVLFNSLSPGYLTPDGSDYTPPSGPGGDEQVFKAISNGIIVGSSVKYAARQNKTRPFIPKEVPKAWLARWSETAVNVIGIALQRYLLGGAA